MDQITMPSSLAEVETLIHRLYEPNPASTLAQIQEVLQKLQRSPEGWQIADGLLDRPADNIKFFGALTVIVKLNTDTIDDDGAKSVLHKLINWLLKSLDNGAGALVVRKLCSALVTHFIHFSHIWPRCVRDLLYCLDLGRGEALEDSKNAPPIERLVQDLSPQKSVAAAWFTTSLAEEAEKIDPKSTKYIGLHERLLNNSQDVSSMLVHSLSTPSGSQSQIELIACLQAWTTYGQRVPSERLTNNLRPLIQPTIKCLVVDELYGPTVELLTDILSNWQTFFTSTDYSLLYSLFESEWSQSRYQNLLQGDFDFDYVQFGVFMVAFGDAQITELMDRTNERSQRFLVGLVGLLTAKGHPVAEDKIFGPALEFWSQFIESIVDNIFSESPNPADWSRPPFSHIMQVVSHCWRKIQYPSLSEFNSWDSTERTGFGDARKDVADLLQSVYTISGESLISIFVNLTLQGVSTSAWAELEAAAFCLGSLSDCVSDGSACDEILTKVFGSSLFDLLRQGHSVVPVRARQTCLSLIERYSEYFGRHAEFLPAALNLLFSAVSDQPLAGSSSKSIHRLCSSCRTLLTSEVDAFLGHYGSLRESQNIDSLAEERVVGAVASIIQAIPEEARRLDAFKRLILLVGADVERCFELKSSDSALGPNDPAVMRAFDIAQRPTVPVSSSEVSSLVAIRALRCLLGIAKGLQAPTESLVDVDADETNANSSTHPELQHIQQEIMGMLVRMKDTFPENTEALGIICSILRAGFSETEPGPFVFEPQLVTDFLTSPWYSRVASAVTTASVFVSSLHNGSHKSQIPKVLGRLLPWALGLLQQLQEPENDTELAQYAIEFAQRAMVTRPDLLMQLQPSSSVEYLFMFAIKLLNGSEPLPKYAAAEFWTNFITLKSTDASTQVALEGAIAHLGPMLAHSLVLNIGGNASRSDLDKLSDPLKKMVVQHVHARQWLEAALNDPSFPSDKVSGNDKALFLKKILSLRGSRATNQVVREFWLACRGSNFAYAS